MKFIMWSHTHTHFIFHLILNGILLIQTIKRRPKCATTTKSLLRMKMRHLFFSAHVSVCDPNVSLHCFRIALNVFRGDFFAIFTCIMLNFRLNFFICTNVSHSYIIFPHSVHCNSIVEIKQRKFRIDKKIYMIFKSAKH